MKDKKIIERERKIDYRYTYLHIYIFIFYLFTIYYKAGSSNGSCTISKIWIGH